MSGKRPAFPARLDLTSGAPQPARTGLPPLRKPVAEAASRATLEKTAGTAKPSAPPTRAPVAASSGKAATAPRPADGQLQFRRRMVERLAQDQGIHDPAVLQAMAAVERHRFVDAALLAQAYEDTSLPIGLSQTISKPSVVARMIELLRQGLAGAAASGTRHPGRVLEIGTGCGYQAAVLAQVVREVYSIERLRGLHERARENLRPFRIPNVHLLLGDGMEGYAKGAPYAGILAAAGGEAVPQAWIDQLAVGGRLVAPVVVDASGSEPRQALLVLDKTPAGLKRTLLEAVHFVPLKSGIA
ncbi:MAG: Protein-L-isoaspartate O-methyltransferase [Paracidovorax wautersii]|uniref:Protein-L-isoaspartate O-methyltransferase n=1 Tax=Paracidovorax wautersii TaxID=1177982 RepID=A0A7V8FMN0_9BURK|nr:MAG: Protein-L-isoaspartate O-methyltransferase [Paracidovorax wautersii]